MAWTDPELYSHLQLVTATNLNKISDNLKEVEHEVAYTEFAAGVTRAGSNIDVVSAGAITFAAKPIVIEFWAPSATVASATSLVASLFDDTTDLGILATFQVPTVTAGSLIWPVGAWKRKLTPSAASHTYKVRLTAGSGTISAGAGGAGGSLPGYIRILQKGGV